MKRLSLKDADMGSITRMAQAVLMQKNVDLRPTDRMMAVYNQTENLMDIADECVRTNNTSECWKVQGALGEMAQTLSKDDLLKLIVMIEPGSAFAPKRSKRVTANKNYVILMTMRMLVEELEKLVQGKII
jgi:hypothetical protein